MLSGTRPDARHRQPAAVEAVRRPVALHRRRREPLGRARDRPRGADRRAGGRRRRAVHDPDRRLDGDRSASVTRLAFVELMEQCERQRDRRRRRSCTRRRAAARTPACVAGRALWQRAPRLEHGAGGAGDRRRQGRVDLGWPDVAELAADDASRSAGGHRLAGRPTATSQIDPDWIGDDYAVPTKAGDAAIRWAARHGGWVLDRVYTRQGLRRACSATPTRAVGRAGDDVVFIHTGGCPAVFAPDGVPSAALTGTTLRRTPWPRSSTSTCWRSRRRPVRARRAVVDGVVAQPRRPGSCTPATTCRRICSTPPTACCASSSRCRPTSSSSSSSPGAHGQTGYTGLLVETAASSDKPDWKEMLNWASPIASRPPAQAQVRHRLPRSGVARVGGARHHRGAVRVPRRDRRSATALPARDRRGHRLPRDVLRRDGHATGRR